MRRTRVTMKPGWTVGGMLWAWVVWAGAAEIHVSPAGDDGNPGTRERPLATLEAARDAVRALRAGAADKTRRHTVVVHGGVYRRDRTFELDGRDSFTTFQADESAADVPRLLGGVEIPAGAAKPVRNPRVLGRLVEEAARAHLHAVDLKALGITDYGTLGPRGFRRAYKPAPLELFIDGQPMQIARWPNAGEPHVPMGKVLDKGSAPRFGDYAGRPGTFAYGVERPKNWTKAKDLYVSGLFAYGYADDTIEVAKLDTGQGTFTTRHPHLYGFKQQSFTKWYALNLLEEIDQPGEYFVDAGSGHLYFHPPDGFGSDSTLAVSMLEVPLVAIEGATGVVLDGLTLEVSRGSGIYIERGADNVIRGCTLRNLGIVAVQVGMGVEPFPYGKHDGCGNKGDGKPGQPVSRRLGSWHEHIYKFTAFDRKAGTGHRIIGCDIHDIGAGGVSLGGGDRKTLAPGDNAVINCDIHRVNRWDRTYKAPVNIDGVGNKVVHCRLHHCPGIGVYLHGNDHLIEFNEFDHLLTDMSDMGAIYMGRDPSETGNIFRHNFFHHIRNYHQGGHGVQAIFFDDCSICGADIIGNVFHRAGSNGSIKFNGGGAVPIVDNIFVDGPSPVIGGGNNTGRVRKFMNGSLGKQRLRQRVDITKPPYSEKYPRLLAIYQGKAPVTTTPVRSIVTTAGDPRFVDGPARNFALKPDAEVPDGFRRFDSGRIGLYLGDGRDHLPLEPPQLEAGTRTRFRGETSVAFVVPEDAEGIVFTTDGTPPTAAATRYTGPVSIRDDTVVMAATRRGGKVSEPTVVRLDRIEGDPVREAKINFQPAEAAAPDGWRIDTGEVFGDRDGGTAYGWSRDNREAARRRGKDPEPLRDTLVHFGKDTVWEAAVVDGEYELVVLIGDAEFPCKNQTIFVEDTTLCEGVDLDGGEFKELKKRVTVRDGLLTLASNNAPHGPALTRINWVAFRLAE